MVIPPRMSAFVTMVRAVAHPRGVRWPAWRTVLLLSAGIGVWIGVFLLHGAGAAAAQVAPPESGVRSDASARYLILNVEISDDGIQPSAVFIPAGQPVQLVLRGRGRTEHHYRVVGLVPNELLWMAAPASTMTEDVSDDDHAHHDRAFDQWRETSPAGISPTGDEVHAYVSPARAVDVVLFSTTQTGTFVVQCDLHPEKVGKLVVFDDGRRPAAVAAGQGDALSVARASALSIAPGDAMSRAVGNPLSLALGNPLSVELTRDLGSLDYPGAPRVFLEATYAPAEYEALILGGPAAMAELEPDDYVAVLLTEAVRTGNLPGTAEPPDLYLGGSPLPLIDSTVTTDLPRQRATFYRFARDDASDTGDQAVTLRLASGQEAVWDRPSSGGRSWVAPVIFAGGLGLFGWLVWTMAGGRVRRSHTTDLETP